MTPAQLNALTPAQVQALVLTAARPREATGMS